MTIRPSNIPKPCRNGCWKVCQLILHRPQRLRDRDEGPTRCAAFGPGWRSDLVWPSWIEWPFGVLRVPRRAQPWSGNENNRRRYARIKASSNAVRAFGARATGELLGIGGRGRPYPLDQRRARDDLPALCRGMAPDADGYDRHICHLP